MHPTLRQQQDAIAQLCREFGVVRLEVFGSSNRQDFDIDTSDYDFIVDMGSYRRGIGRRSVAFADAMESFLGRRVDFVFEERMKPRFREAAAETCEVVFASGDSTIAA